MIDHMSQNENTQNQAKRSRSKTVENNRVTFMTEK